jgi:hypothetical protein
LLIDVGVPLTWLSYAGTDVRERRSTMSDSTATRDRSVSTSRRNMPQQCSPIAVGSTVVAEDGPVGRVEHVLRTEAAEPRFVVVSTRGKLRRRHPVVSCELVTGVDPSANVIRLRGRRASIRALSEAIPLVV